MLDVPDTIKYENLSTAQRQALVENELTKWQGAARARAHTLFRTSASSSTSISCRYASTTESIEMLLLLVWRHLAVYAAEGGAAPLAGTQGFGASMRVAASFDPAAFRTDASRRLAPVVHRLGVMVRILSSLSGRGADKMYARQRTRWALAGSNTKSTWTS